MSIKVILQNYNTIHKMCIRDRLIADRLFLRNLHLDAGIAVAVLFAGHHADFYGISSGGDRLKERQSVLQRCV